MRSRRSVWLVLVGVLAALCYANFLLDLLLSPDHDWTVVVSELELPGEPTATLLRATDVLGGVLVLLLLPAIHAALPANPWRWWVVWTTAIFAVAGALAGLVPLPCAADQVCTDGAAEVQRWLHDGFSTVSQLSVFLGAAGAALGVRRTGPRWLRLAGWLTFWVGGILGTLAFGYFGSTDPTSWPTGTSQRVQVLVTSAWILCLAVFAASRPRPRPR